MAIVVCDPGLTQQVLTDDRTFDKGGPLFAKYREAFGEDIVTCPHEGHRRQRRLIQPAFHPGRLPSYARLMTEQIVDVIGQWRDGQVVDVLADMQSITARVAVKTMFADAFRSPEIADTLDDFTVIMEGVYRQMLLPAPLARIPTPGNRRYARARVRIQRTADNMIGEYRSNGIDRGDVLSVLLATRDDDRQGLSDAEISSQVMSFFLGATETAASTLAWALHLLAHHRAVEDQLHAEVDGVVAGGATFDDLPKLPVAGRIITETLRLYPPGWLLTRVVTADTELGGHRIPAGTVIVYSPYLLHHRSDLFPQPERFDPDRWDSGNCAPPPRGTLIPFGGGARKCMGDSFAVTEATLALATIAARWRLESLPEARVRPARGIVLRPHGLLMRVTSRSRRRNRA